MQRDIVRHASLKLYRYLVFFFVPRFRSRQFRSRQQRKDASFTLSLCAVRDMRRRGSTWRRWKTMEISLVCVHTFLQEAGYSSEICVFV